jgi:hypothetical protein
MRGRSIGFSKSRRTVIDLLYFANQFPTLPVQRRMGLAPVVAARAACRDRPQWTAIFAKAYAMTAREVPELRRAYVKFPWPQLYEYPVSVANIAFERDYRGESSFFSFRIKNPAGRPLTELQALIRHAATAPIQEVKDFRRSLWVSGLPLPLRRFLWWIALNIGRERANYFGTFGVSVYSALNGESLHPLAPMTVLLNYGVIAGDGKVDVRMIYDHRVMNGASVARALAKLEQVLKGLIVEELRTLSEAG